MSTSSHTISCNRQPFLSESGCDRGSVDIHRFNDLPYCGTINPTVAEIPPEIIDTPINLPVPPTCACIDIDFAFNAKYTTSRKFKDTANFRAIGDCCEGRYQSDFSLQIPCPVTGTSGKKEISLKLGYGTRKTTAKAAFMQVDKDDCEINPKSVSFDMNLPCPVNSGTKRISMKLGYGTGRSTAVASYVQADGQNCTLIPKDIDMRLNLPCPVSGDGKMKIGISYGKTFKGASRSFLGIDAAKCDLRPLSPEFDLQIPCPVLGNGGSRAIELVVTTGNQTVRTRTLYADTNAERCNIDIRDANLSLNLPCPLTGNNTEAAITPELKWGKQFDVEKVTILRVDHKACQITPYDTKMDLTIPCPIGDDKNKLKVSLSYGNGNRSASAQVIKKTGECEIKPVDASLHLNIPCPLRGTKNITITPGIGAKGGGAVTIPLLQDNGSCNIDVPQTSIDLRVPCPVSTIAQRKLKFEEIKFGPPNVEEQVLADQYDCGIDVQDMTFSLNVPCPLNSKRLLIETSTVLSYSGLSYSGLPGIDFSSSFGFPIDSGSYADLCARRIKFKLLLPKANIMDLLGMSYVHKIEWDPVNHKILGRKRVIVKGSNGHLTTESASAYSISPVPWSIYGITPPGES